MQNFSDLQYLVIESYINELDSIVKDCESFKFYESMKCFNLNDLEKLNQLSYFINESLNFNDLDNMLKVLKLKNYPYPKSIALELIFFKSVKKKEDEIVRSLYVGEEELNSKLYCLRDIAQCRPKMHAYIQSLAI